MITFWWEQMGETLKIDMVVAAALFSGDRVMALKSSFKALVPLYFLFLGVAPLLNC